MVKEYLLPMFKPDRKGSSLERDRSPFGYKSSIETHGSTSTNEHSISFQTVKKFIKPKTVKEELTLTT